MDVPLPNKLYSPYGAHRTHSIIRLRLAYVSERTSECLCHTMSFVRVPYGSRFRTTIRCCCQCQWNILFSFRFGLYLSQPMLRRARTRASVSWRLILFIQSPLCDGGHKSSEKSSECTRWTGKMNNSFRLDTHENAELWWHSRNARLLYIFIKCAKRK